MSRAPWSDRQTVEQCLCLSAIEMRRDGVFKVGPGGEWLLKREGSWGQSPVTIRYSILDGALFNSMSSPNRSTS